MMEGQQAAGETGEEKEQRGSQTDIAVQQDQDGRMGAPGNQGTAGDAGECPARTSRAGLLGRYRGAGAGARVDGQNW